MMRRRSALLLIALYVLASAATAYAECAWVLWVRTQVPGQATTTSVLGAYEARAECKNAEREEIAGVRAKFPSAKMKVDRETVWVWNEKSAATMITHDYYCLPDTVDPRGAKGK
ncbi:MAG: hypothetical protein DMD87_09320 [Candidatus Rokuibacteriota bacterium]|nr:MAG: hypothetical protein DMD87_09320 [Candidatus Rokubacteria bacterium]